MKEYSRFFHKKIVEFNLLFFIYYFNFFLNPKIAIALINNTAIFTNTFVLSPVSTLALFVSDDLIVSDGFVASNGLTVSSGWLGCTLGFSTFFTNAVNNGCNSATNASNSAWFNGFVASCNLVLISSNFAFNSAYPDSYSSATNPLNLATSVSNWANDNTGGRYTIVNPENLEVLNVIVPSPNVKSVIPSIVPSWLCSIFTTSWSAFLGSVTSTFWF